MYDDVERAALAIAETATDPVAAHDNVDEYDAARAVLGDDKAALLAWAAICINGWNRMHALSRTPVEGA